MNPYKVTFAAAILCLVSVLPSNTCLGSDSTALSKSAYSAIQNGVLTQKGYLKIEAQGSMANTSFWMSYIVELQGMSRTQFLATYLQSVKYSLRADKITPIMPIEPFTEDDGGRAILLTGPDNSSGTITVVVKGLNANRILLVCAGATAP